MKLLSFFIFFLSLGFCVYAQNRIETDKYIGFDVLLTEEPIVLDGILDEQSWVRAKAAREFSQYFPYDTILAVHRTEIYMCYDDAKCKAETNDFVVPSLRRDYGFSGSDNISFLFDTFNDKTNAFLFGINPYGVIREALISNGGRTGGSFDDSWDNTWAGNAKIYEDYWIAEIAIPFKTLRFNEGTKSWRFNSYRFDTQENEITTWVNIPTNRILMDLSYMGEMKWEAPLKKSGKNVSIIPYTIAGAARDFENVDEESTQTNFNIGGDAKIAINSGLNLDLTFNPDFSQVEVDRQVTNLSRFEIFFPERRQFFLENADLFGNFGNGSMNPFFSRRIGVSQDTTTGSNIQNTIYYGARLSGKLNDKLRIGLINMQTAAQEENDLPSFNYTTLALEQQVFDRSSLAFILVNKEAFNSENFSGTVDPYNRVGGLEYRLASSDNSWVGKFSYFRAITPGGLDKKFSHYAQLQHIKRRYTAEWAHSIIGEGFDAQVGFVPRKDILRLNPRFDVDFYPNGSILTRHTIGIRTDWFYKLGDDDNEIIEDFNLAERNLSLNWNLRFKDNSSLNVELGNRNIILLNDFDPTRIQDEDVFLSAGSEYNFTAFSMRYRSNRAKKFALQFNPIIGEFFNGFRAGVSGAFSYRYQPFGSISLNYTYNHIKLDGDFEEANLWLVGPRLDLTFSKKTFFTTFVQYNSQLDNININSRFQWRFKPVSDFFIVYSDNYLTDNFSQFSVRNRSIILKFTYWLTI
jgi:hypothetical protein